MCLGLAGLDWAYARRASLAVHGMILLHGNMADPFMLYV